ncbi:MAG TPA: hypothetical protein PKH03_09605 [Syntrophales bacterium]|nr:hypothetical protein [Syntrophales bacterium]
MAEIKSTLDLIMERTKNMQLSPAEKAEIRLRETSGTVRGWLQKFADGLLSAETLQALYTEATAHSPEVRDLMRAELIERIALDGENTDTIVLIERLFDIRTAPLKNLVRSFRNKRKRLDQQGRDAARAALADCGITGGAVVPNPSLDPGRPEALAQLEAAFLKEREALSARL